MSKRLYRLIILLEAGLVGVFFIQSLRFLIGSLYSRVSSVALILRYPAGTVPENARGLVDPNMLNTEIILLGVCLALPILMLLLGRWRIVFLIAIAFSAIGRALINNPLELLSPTMGAELAFAGGLMYISLLSSQRSQNLPYFFVLGIAADQVLRALGNTLDPTIFDAGFANSQIILSVVLGVIGLLGVFLPMPSNTGQSREGANLDLNKGVLTLWGAIGLGALLFLELSLLGLPNAIAGRSNADYTTFAPLLLAATVLPLSPLVRAQARRFISPFDENTRGWIWLIVLALLIVLGTRVQNIPVGGFLVPVGAVALVLAQFAASMIWWWLVRPKAEHERNWGGLWLVLSMVIFTLLVVFDYFTYAYAFVESFAAPLDFLNPYVPALLRGFRGFGLGVILLASFLAVLPMIQSTRRIPWSGGKWTESLAWFMVIIAFVVTGTLAVQPPQVFAVANVPELRIGTYNIHSGYSEFFETNLEGIAQSIEIGGANVVLMQAVDAGRLISFGVDQSLWLARRLGMDRRFYATNEGLYGLAVLSKVEIVFADGILLPSIDQQTGLQRVQIRPDAGVITLYNTSLGLLLQGQVNSLEGNQLNQLNTILGTIAAHVQQDYGGQLGRAVLGGTFHNVPTSPLMQLPRQYGFIDPFAGSNLTLSATLRRYNLPPARYDYLWLWSQSLEAIGTNVIDSDASDHRLAVVGVRIRSN